MVITQQTSVSDVQNITKETMQQLVNVSKVDCNDCNFSKFAGFAMEDKGQHEQCIKFCTPLERAEDNISTIPCKECNGTYFEEDRYDANWAENIYKV